MILVDFFDGFVHSSETKPQSVTLLSVFPLFSAERQLSLFCFHQPGRARSHSSPTLLVPGRTRPPLEIDKIANTQSELRNKYNHHVCEDNNIKIRMWNNNNK